MLSTLLPLLFAGVLALMPQRTLAPCPDTPNCVSTEAERSEQRMPPIPFTDSSASAMRRVRAALLDESRVTVTGEEFTWIKAEVRSVLFRFVDDVELIVDEGAKVIRFRSASRVGRSDLGVNRKRMARIAERLRTP